MYQVVSQDCNGSIRWRSDRQMPAIVGSETLPVVKRLMAGLNFEIASGDIQYVVHTGGPAILRGTQSALKVPDEQLQVKRRLACL